MRSVKLLTICVAALLAAACGGDGKTAPNVTNAASAPVPVPAPAATAPHATTNTGDAALVVTGPIIV